MFCWTSSSSTRWPVKDACERNRVPKLHAYSDHVFVVLHTPELGRRGHVHYIELDQFIGRHYLVTVHGPNNSGGRPRCRAAPDPGGVAADRGRSPPAGARPFELSHAIVSAHDPGAGRLRGER